MKKWLNRFWVLISVRWPKYRNRKLRYSWALTNMMIILPKPPTDGNNFKVLWWFRNAERLLKLDKKWFKND